MSSSSIPLNESDAEIMASEQELAALLQQLVALRLDMLEYASQRLRDFRPYFSSDQFTPSAWNLAQYLALRRHDLRTLQDTLASYGFSSLGHSEAHILQTLNNLIHLLSMTLGTETPALADAGPCVSYHSGQRLLQSHTQAVFGHAPEKRAVRIMVTLPSHAAEDYQLVRELLARGMNCARINCAHDSEVQWLAMVKHVRTAASELGSECKILMDLGGHKIRTGAIASTGKKASAVNAIRVNLGDHLLLSRNAAASTEAVYAADGSVETPVTLASTCPEIFQFISPGEAMWIDDGKIGTLIESVSDTQAMLRVTSVGPKGGRIKADKGLNFPDTALKLPALSSKDIADLDFVARHADMVGFSFVQCLEDICSLVDELKKRDADQLPIIAKIETRRAVRKLPDILLGAMGRHPIGVMIARGDLAVELGGERMAEIQEELLWVCEAAHVPVIWATQVLESLAKKGVASRPELTDAAMGERAECVMLNKGPYILNAVSTLSDILTRMEAHQLKKRSQLRALSWWS